MYTITAVFCKIATERTQKGTRDKGAVNRKNCG